MENVARLKYLQYRSVVVLSGFSTIHRLMQMRIEGHAQRIDALRAEACNIVDKLLVNEFEALAVVGVLRLAVRGQRLLETVDHWNQPFDHARRRAPGGVGTLFLHAFSVIVEVRLPAQQGLTQVF